MAWVLYRYLTHHFNRIYSLIISHWTKHRLDRKDSCVYSPYAFKQILYFELVLYIVADNFGQTDG